LIIIYMNNFWVYLDELIAQSKIIIDRPKGSVHPRYPQIVYELDYGYLDGTKSSDNEGIDVWLGTGAEQKLDAIVCTVDLVKKDSEIKLFLTSSLGHPKIFVKEFFNGFVPFHDHCPGEKLSVEWQTDLHGRHCLSHSQHLVYA